MHVFGVRALERKQNSREKAEFGSDLERYPCSELKCDFILLARSRYKRVQHTC